MRSLSAYLETPRRSSRTVAGQKKTSRQCIAMVDIRYPWIALKHVVNPLDNPVLFMKIGLVLSTLTIFAVIKPKEYTFLDMIFTLFYGRPNALTEPDGRTVKTFREASVAMRIIAVTTIALLAIIG